MLSTILGTFTIRVLCKSGTGGSARLEKDFLAKRLCKVEPRHDPVSRIGGGGSTSGVPTHMA